MIVDAQIRLDVMDLHARYAACLDSGDFDGWPSFFTEDCRYRVVARENYDQNLPLSIMDLQSRGALMDRVYGIQSTLFHAPYYQRHIVGPALVTMNDREEIASEANYLVIRTKRDLPSELFNAGRYVDRIVQTPQGLKFAAKTCVFDSELIPNSIIYPI
ncbi:salicylate hydroxylase [Sphingobium sp. LB126]|nr:salicylate hydroxylase [Sphingobium sp. LB126]